ncbi:DUF3291 domain-containing protein [uncultured Vibrio sp.]|uniref:DUF3291 domain-containing protein n=1 Tax=uncultured Vibrio sp. TaxID=114054 RepID=UPI00262BF158|nr:DUF3291 domain-containing protein [uncultured Vibrio sp.]
MKLAQLNIALAKYPLDAPKIKDFVDNLDKVNGIAESSEGFVWRLKDESGDATNIKAFDDPNMIVNMSIWDSVDSLKNFMFRTHHRDFMRRKGEWFHRLAEDTYVLWWVEDDHIPSLDEAIERLEHLRETGDSPYAFTFKASFCP